MHLQLHAKEDLGCVVQGSLVRYGANLENNQKKINAWCKMLCGPLFMVTWE